MADFERLFCENYSFIYKYLLKLSCNASLAEELTQETFFRAYMNMSAVRDESKLPIWLCQIAKNTYFAWYNRQKKFADTDRLTENADIPSPEEELILKEMTSAAARRLDELDEPYKKVFIMHALCDISLKEISNTFGKSEAWARVTFYRAKQKLKEGIE